MDPRRIFGHVFGIEASIAMAVFAAVSLCMIVALFLSHRRRRTGRPAAAKEKNTPLELGLAACFAGVAAFVVGLSFHSNAQETSADPPGRATVAVTAFQWCWRFDYPGRHRSVTNDCTHFGHRPTMVVPVGQAVTVHITSADVIHSWWVPALRYKMDAFPHHTNTFTITVDHAGRWVGRCAELCGERHFEMDFWLKAVPADQYRQWLAGGPIS